MLPPSLNSSGDRRSLGLPVPEEPALRLSADPGPWPFVPGPTLTNEFNAPVWASRRNSLNAGLAAVGPASRRPSGGDPVRAPAEPRPGGRLFGEVVICACAMAREGARRKTAATAAKVERREVTWSLRSGNGKYPRRQPGGTGPARE